MALSANPTRTRMIERAWVKEINRRWARFIRAAVTKLRQENAGEIVTNAGEAFTLDPSRQRSYLAWLENQIETSLLGPADSGWQSPYQAAAYERAIEATRRSLRAQGAAIAPTPAERMRAEGFQAMTATPSLAAPLAGVTSQPIHSGAFQFLTSRSYESLKNVTGTMATEIGQVLHDGVRQGQGVDEVVRNMTGRAKVARTRAKLIARTETNQAYGKAAILEAEVAADEIGDEVKLRWLTVRDGNVRHLHATFHGQVMAPKEAEKNKAISPWNCRCGFAPVIPEADTPEKQAKFDGERKTLLALEKKAPPPKAKPRKTPRPSVAKKKPAPARRKTPQVAPDDDGTAAWMAASLAEKQYAPYVKRAGTPRLVPPNARQGAYHTEGKIHMAAYTPDTPAGRAVYRHEFGHYVDYSNGRVSHTVEFDQLVRGVDKRLRAEDRAFYKKHAATVGVTGAYSANKAKQVFKAVAANTEMDYILETAATGGKVTPAGAVKWAKSQVPKGSPAAEFLDLLESAGVSADRHIDQAVGLVTAHRHDYGLGYVHVLWDRGLSSQVRNVYREGGQIADLVGAISGNRWGGGHSAGYYRQRSYRLPGYGPIRPGNNTEAFAQLFSLMGDEAGPLGQWAIATFAPELLKHIEGLL